MLAKYTAKRPLPNPRSDSTVELLGSSCLGRPEVLVLRPFRSSPLLAWYLHLTSLEPDMQEASELFLFRGFLSLVLELRHAS